MSWSYTTNTWVKLSPDNQDYVWTAVNEIEAISYDGGTSWVHTKNGNKYPSDYLPEKILNYVKGAPRD